jgi:hypothetical protein
VTKYHWTRSGLDTCRKRRESLFRLFPSPSDFPMGGSSWVSEEYGSTVTRTQQVRTTVSCQLQFGLICFVFFFHFKDFTLPLPVSLSLSVLSSPFSETDYFSFSIGFDLECRFSYWNLGRYHFTASPVMYLCCILYVHVQYLCMDSNAMKSFKTKNVALP